MGAATSVAARSPRTPCALDARYGQEETIKEILGTILDPSSQTEDFAAPLPEAYRGSHPASSTRTIPSRNRNDALVTSRKLLRGMRSRLVFSRIPGSGRKTNDSKMQEER